MTLFVGNLFFCVYLLHVVFCQYLRVLFGHLLLFMNILFVYSLSNLQSKGNWLHGKALSKKKKKGG